MASSSLVDPRVEAALGAVGAVTAVLLFASPITTFKRIVASKSTEEFSPFPYVSALLNCTVWVLYALPFVTPNRASPLFTNIIGLVFQSVYIFLFIKYAREKPKQYILQLLAGYLGFIGFLIFLMAFIVPAEMNSPMLGYCATAFCVIMFGSPLAALSVVLKTRSVEFMPLPLSLMGFACSSSWTVYGLYVQDMFVIAPNVFGMILGVAQLTIYFWISHQSIQRKLSRGDVKDTELQEQEPLTKQ